MQLLSLRLENFRQHKNSEFHFPKGLVGILGPNGTGKSTLLEAIAWGLYGSERGVLRSNTEGLIWQQAPGKASAIVELTLPLGGAPTR
ncbi:MAG: AAA family ATPase [Oscillatoriales cyanobacterium SM2_1_8]|nr:AAA family ATPase [Oscillatoriales cyanobacterium SM2_1_8]